MTVPIASQAEPGYEQDDPDGNRDNGGDQLLAKQGVGIQRTDRTGTEPQGEQHQDRWQPQDLADQGRRRQDDHKPQLEQRLRLGERRYRDRVDQGVHRCAAGPMAGFPPTLPSRPGSETRVASSSLRASW